MLLVNPSEPLPLLAAVPKSAFPLPQDTPTLHLPALWDGDKGSPGLGGGGGGCASLQTYLKHQGRVPSTAGCVALGVPILPAPQPVGQRDGSWEGTAEQCSWHCAGPGSWGPLCRGGDPPALLHPHQRLHATPLALMGQAGRTCRAQGCAGNAWSRARRRKDAVCFSIFSPSTHPTSPPSFHPPPCAGMKQPHLEIPSLLKAGSARQRAPSGKPPHYAVPRQPGGAPGMGGLGGAAWMHGIEPTCVAMGPDLCWPPRWQGDGREQAGQWRMLSSPNASLCRAVLPRMSLGTAPCSQGGGPGGAGWPGLSAAPAAESPGAQWHHSPLHQGLWGQRRWGCAS